MQQGLSIFRLILNRDAIRRFSTPAIQEFLNDSFNRKHDYLRISLNDKCNLRCFYCMPDEHQNNTSNTNFLTSKEIIFLSEFFIRRGIRKIKLTGGEPLLRPDLTEIISGINQVSLQYPKFKGIGMTTNGINLHRKLEGLITNGLTNVNISLDTLDSSKFIRITRRNGFKLVMQSIFSSLQQKPLVVKINCVLVRGVNDDEVLDFVEFTKQHPVQIRFIEFMPFSENKWNFKSLVCKSEVLNKVRERYTEKSIIQIPMEDPNSTSTMFKLEGFLGSFGIISSMTEHFCGSCNRLRITADGNLKICLHDSREFNLLHILRNNKYDKEHKESELDTFVRSNLALKKFKHGDLDISKGTTFNRSMTRIGG